MMNRYFFKSLLVRWLAATVIGLAVYKATAGDIITATVVVTNASNFNTNPAASLTHSGLVDTRIWTNTVTSSSTQIQSSTNIANAAFQLLRHFRLNPFTDVQTLATNNGIILIGADGDALSLVASNSWASISYRTQTVATGAIVLRSPRASVDDPTERAKGDDDIPARMNNAPTNTVSETAPAMVGYVNRTQTQTVTGFKTLSNTNNLFTAQQLTFDQSELAVDNGGTNFWVDLLGDAGRTITATNHLNFQATTNRAAVGMRNVVLVLLPNGTNRNLTFNSSWNFLSTKPTVLTNATLGILSLTSWGSSETNVLAVYSFSQ